MRKIAKNMLEKNDAIYRKSNQERDYVVRRIGISKYEDEGQ